MFDNVGPQESVRFVRAQGYGRPVELSVGLFLNVHALLPAKPANIKSFHRLRQAHIRQQNHRQEHEVQRRQRLSFEVVRKRSHRQEDANDHDDSSHHHQWHRCATLQERDFRCADHVHDQRLGQQPDHEPTT